MSERPIVLRGHQVLAALADRKLTHRVVAAQIERAPYGVGDLLWVKEAWCQKCDLNAKLIEGQAWYAADGKWVSLSDGDGGTALLRDGREASPWRSPSSMPRWASRLSLEVTDIRSERLQQVTESAARLEGLEPTYIPERWTAFDPLTGAYPSFSGDPNVGYGPGDGHYFEDVRCHPPELLETARNKFRWLWDEAHPKAPWEADPLVWVITWKRRV